MNIPDAARVEIIEYTETPDDSIIIPNELRINGVPILCPADHPIVVERLPFDGSEPAMITVTMFVGHLSISKKPASTQGE